MPRPSTKAQLLQDSQVKFEKLFALIDGMSLYMQEGSFAHNERDCSFKDVLVHLYEWQILSFNFIHTK
nr:ClbS/DfsB family four-helix bundle protein [uncultured Helicobacter sp.]